MYYVHAVDEPPFPSPADAGYLLFPIAICAGLVVYPTGRRGHSRSRVLLDGAPDVTIVDHVKLVRNRAEIAARSSQGESSLASARMSVDEAPAARLSISR